MLSNCIYIYSDKKSLETKIQSVSVFVTDELKLIFRKQVVLTSLLFKAESCGDSFICRWEKCLGFDLLKYTYIEICAVMHSSFHLKTFDIDTEMPCFS